MQKVASSRRVHFCALIQWTAAIPCRVRAPVMYQKLCSKVKLCSSVSGSAHSLGLILQDKTNESFHNIIQDSIVYRTFNLNNKIIEMNKITWMILLQCNIAMFCQDVLLVFMQITFFFFFLHILQFALLVTGCFWFCSIPHRDNSCQIQVCKTGTCELAMWQLSYRSVIIHAYFCLTNHHHDNSNT